MPSPVQVGLLRAHVSALSSFTFICAIHAEPEGAPGISLNYRFPCRVHTRLAPQLGGPELQPDQGIIKRAKWTSLRGTASAGTGTVPVPLRGGGELNLGPFQGSWMQCLCHLTQTISMPQRFQLERKHVSCFMCLLLSHVIESLKQPYGNDCPPHR